MAGHHLILGQLEDVISGHTLADTHDERYRQKIARLLLQAKGYHKADIRGHQPLEVRAGTRKAVIKVDFIVRIGGRIGMVIKYGPGSLVTRHRPALAASRLVAGHWVPVVVVTNGEDADIIEGRRGKPIAQGLAGIPSRQDLAQRLLTADLEPISEDRAGIESRILYAFEVDGSCPCDETICRT